MVDLFLLYEKELEGLLGAMSSPYSTEVTADGLAEAENLIWKMSSEARSHPPQQKEALLGKVCAAFHVGGHASMKRFLHPFFQTSVLGCRLAPTGSS